MLRIALAFILCLLWTAPAWCALPTILWKVGRTYRAENKTDAHAITIAVRLTKPDAQDVTATITAAGANTTTYGMGKDLDLSATTVTIPAGSLVPKVEGVETQPTVTIVNNPTLNLDRIVALTLTSPSANARVGYSRVFVNLVDDARSGIKDVPAPSGGDDTAAIQVVIDEAHAAEGADKDNYVIRFQTGTYRVSKTASTWCVKVYPGNTYIGSASGTTIKRFGNSPEPSSGERLFSTQSSVVRDNARMLGIKRLNFDSNNQQTDEHSSLIFIGVQSESGETVNCAVEDVNFIGPSKGDGLQIHYNTNIKVYNCQSTGFFRGAWSITGGNSVVDINKFDTTGGNNDIEVDSQGYDGSYDITLTLSNSIIDGMLDLGLGTATGSVVTITNITATTSYIYTYEPGPVIIINNSTFNVDYNLEAKWSSVYNLTFNNCSFIKKYDPLDLYPLVLPAWYPQRGTTDAPPAGHAKRTGEVVTFNDCIFKTDGSFPANINVSVINPVIPASGAVIGDDRTNENKLIFNSCVFGDDTAPDISCVYALSSTSSLRGGWVEFHDCEFNLLSSGNYYPFMLSGSNDIANFYFELDNCSYNANRFIFFNNNESGNQVKIKQFSITNAQNIISGNYNLTTFDSADTIIRSITGSGNPDGSVKGFCNSDASKYDQWHDTVSGKYYKCVEKQTTWTEYTP